MIRHILKFLFAIFAVGFYIGVWACAIYIHEVQHERATFVCHG